MPTSFGLAITKVRSILFHLLTPYLCTYILYLLSAYTHISSISTYNPAESVVFGVYFEYVFPVYLRIYVIKLLFDIWPFLVKLDFKSCGDLRLG